MYTESTGWVELPPMKTPKIGCYGLAWGESFVVLGGHDGRTALRHVEAFSVKTQKWTSLPDMADSRDGCCAAIYGDQLYVFGGWSATAGEPS